MPAMPAPLQSCEGTLHSAAPGFVSILHCCRVSLMSGRLICGPANPQGVLVPNLCCPSQALAWNAFNAPTFAAAAEVHTIPMQVLTTDGTFLEVSQGLYVLRCPEDHALKGAPAAEEAGQGSEASQGEGIEAGLGQSEAGSERAAQVRAAAAAAKQELLARQHERQQVRALPGLSWL